MRSFVAFRYGFRTLFHPVKERLFTDLNQPAASERRKTGGVNQLIGAHSGNSHNAPDVRHGPDSQVILLTPAADMAHQVAEAVERQLAELPRAETARQALSASRLIVTNDLAQCVEISNQYGPEHLIIQTRNARDLVDGITSAGSVFLGDWSPESAGDYASGTNHVLPTYGYTATCSSLGLADFQKRMTVQELSKEGFSALASTIETLAAAERLTAHKNAVTLRVNALKEQA